MRTFNEKSGVHYSLSQQNLFHFSFHNYTCYKTKTNLRPLPLVLLITDKCHFLFSIVKSLHVPSGYLRRVNEPLTNTVMKFANKN